MKSRGYILAAILKSLTQRNGFLIRRNARTKVFVIDQNNDEKEVDYESDRPDWSNPPG